MQISFILANFRNVLNWAGKPMSNLLHFLFSCYHSKYLKKSKLQFVFSRNGAFRRGTEPNHDKYFCLHKFLGISTDMTSGGFMSILFITDSCQWQFSVWPCILSKYEHRWIALAVPLWTISSQHWATYRPYNSHAVFIRFRCNFNFSVFGTCTCINRKLIKTVIGWIKIF